MQTCLNQHTVFASRLPFQIRNFVFERYTPLSNLPNILKCTTTGT